MGSVLVVDFRDSFVHTIVSYLRALGARVEVRRSDQTSVDEAAELGPAGVLLSPGPGRPEEARLGHELLDRFTGRVPVLGVCLGHQVIAEHWGPRSSAPRNCATERPPRSSTTAPACSPAAPAR
ncbi:hypothetical protein GCM10029992_14840 [Glycomyces albus]